MTAAPDQDLIWREKVPAVAPPPVATAKVEVHLGSPFMTAPGASWQKLPLDAVDFDTDGIWDAGGLRAVPTRAGYYQVTVRTQCPGFSATYWDAGAAVNGVVRGIGGGSQNMYASSGTVLVFCNGAGDYIEAFVYSSISLAAVTGLDTFMNIIGPL